MTTRRYSSRGKQLSGCVIFFTTVLLTLSFVEMRPIPPGRWSNPCELTSPVLEPVRMLLGLSKQDAEDLCKNIIYTTKVAHSHAEEVLDFYVYHIENYEKANMTEEELKEVEESFKDGSFVEGTASHRLNWLPKVTPNDADDMKLVDAIRYFYSIVQYFGVGLEQIITDQIIYDGTYFTQFRAVEDNMAQLLCTLQLGLASLGGTPNNDVTRDVMNQQYRNVGSRSQRLIRNYLILRDYVHALDVMLTSFEKQAERTLTLTTPILKPTEPKRLVTH